MIDGIVCFWVNIVNVDIADGEGRHFRLRWHFLFPERPFQIHIKQCTIMSFYCPNQQHENFSPQNYYEKHFSDTTKPNPI